jgi:hypothetical protein
MPYDGESSVAYTYEDLLNLTRKHPDVHEELVKHAPNAGRGGDRRSEKVKANQTAARPFSRSNSKVRPVLEARLVQEHPAIYKDFLAGKYRSLRQAAEAAGLVQPGHDPILVDQHGRVVDGRNRLAACALLGIEPWFAAQDFATDADVGGETPGVTPTKEVAYPYTPETIAAFLQPDKKGDLWWESDGNKGRRAGAP